MRSPGGERTVARGPLSSFACCVRASQGHRAADCAHVPRGRLRRPLLLYFAPSATRRPWPGTVVACDRRTPQWCRSRPVGRSAQRSKGGGVGRRATPGDMSGAERRADMLSRRPRRTERMTAPGRQRKCWLLPFRRSGRRAALPRRRRARRSTRGSGSGPSRARRRGPRRARRNACSAPTAGC